MKNIITLNAALILFAAAAIAAGGEGAKGELKVGFSQVDITPPVGAIITGPAAPVSVGTDDPLFAKTLVVQSGDRTLAIVGVDLVKIRRDLADAAIARAWATRPASPVARAAAQFLLRADPACET